MDKLSSTKALVEKILAEDIRARNSDNYLYLKILQATCKGNFEPDKITVEEFLLAMNDFGVPPFESVRRARQKAQAENPSLAACAKIGERRAENQKIYRDFAKA